MSIIEMCPYGTESVFHAAQAAIVLNLAYPRPQVGGQA
jgi:hypothetical protein